VPTTIDPNIHRSSSFRRPALRPAIITTAVAVNTLGGVPAVDLHTHLLPGVDDGPRTLEGALDMARAAEAAGTAAMVATPHVNESHFIEPAAIPPAVDALRGHLRAAGIGLDVRAGGEISLPRAHDLLDRGLAGLGLAGGPYLLLESPFASVAGDFEPLIYAVLSRGHGVLLAHPERCPAFQREPARLRRLVEAGVLVQVTAGAFTGAFGSRVRAFALSLLHEDQAHVLASDAHDAVRRPPGLAQGMAAAELAVPGIGARARWLTEEVPVAIMTGSSLPEPPPLPVARGGGGWRRRLGIRGASSPR